MAKDTSSSTTYALTTPQLTLLVLSTSVTLLLAALGAAYYAGYLDPYIEKLGFIFLKAKAKAEEKKLEALGLKEGQDFVAGELKGNQQADQLAGNLGGGVDSLKKVL